MRTGPLCWPVNNRAAQVSRMLELAGCPPLLPWQSELMADATRDAYTSDLGTHFPVNRVILLAGRQNGKTHLTNTRILAGVLLWHERKIVYTAHLSDTAKDAWTKFQELIDVSPRLRRQVAQVMKSRGDEGIRFRNGAIVSFRTRTSTYGLGLTLDTLILDEALRLDEIHRSNLIPTRSKAASEHRGQMWVVSSAGRADSETLRNIRDTARDNPDPGVLLLEYAAPPHLPPDSPETWALGNPAMDSPAAGHAPILTTETIAAAYGSMSAETFAREFLGRWSTDSGTPFLPPGTWQACQVSAVPAADPARAVAALEVGLGQSALIAAAPTPNGVWVEPLAVWSADTNPETIAAETGELLRVRSIARLVAGDWLLTRDTADTLSRQHARPVELWNMARVRRAMETFRLAVLRGTLSHGPDDIWHQPPTIGSAASGDGSVRMSRKHSPGESAATFAAANAIAAVLEPAPPAPAMQTATRGSSRQSSHRP